MSNDDEMFFVNIDDDIMKEHDIDEGPMTREELSEKLEVIILHAVEQDPLTALDFIKMYVEQCLDAEGIAVDQTKICLKICDVLKSQIELLTNVSPRH